MNRRDFLKKLVNGTLGLSVTGVTLEATDEALGKALPKFPSGTMTVMKWPAVTSASFVSSASGCCGAFGASVWKFE